MSAERGHVYWNGTFSDAGEAALLHRSCLTRSIGILGESARSISAGTIRLAPYLWFDQKYYLPDDILVKSTA